MPKVVIELTANTQAAVAQIQQFAKAQRDAFDAIRAGNPALGDAQVKISKLTTEMGRASDSFGSLDHAAKHAARGGIEELLGQIPVVGSSLATLARTLGGFPLLLGGIIGVGAGVLKFLQGLDENATKSLNSITALSVGIQTKFRATLLDVAKIQATTAGEQVRVVELSAQQEIQSAEDLKNARIAKAKEELDKLNLFGQKRTELSKEALAEIAAAEGEFATQVILTHAKKTAALADLEKQRVEFTKAALATLAQAEADRLRGEGNPLAAIDLERQARLQSIAEEQKAAEAKIAIFAQLAGKAGEAAELRRVVEQTALDKTVSAELDAAEKRRQALEGSTTAAIGIFTKLGPQFEAVTKQLSLSQFLQQSERDLNTLDVALKTGAISLEEFRRGTTAITDAMDEARRTGIVPTTVAVTAQAVAWDQLTPKIVANETALANYGQTAAETDRIVRSLLDGGLAPTTRGFDDMGLELDQLTRDFAAAGQELELNEAKFRNFGPAGKAALDTVTHAADDLGDALTTVGRRTDAVAAALGSLQNPFTSSNPFTGTLTSSPLNFQGSGPGGLITIQDLFAHGLTSGHGGSFFAAGGLVAQPTMALIGEGGPELVLGSPSTQPFAREFAAAIAQALPQASGHQATGGITINVTVMGTAEGGRTLARQIVAEARKEMARGTL